ncbi:ArsR/SmtB family transcription factor [Streptomyces sp. NBC_00690]|uniref:ArsR/SmtB family transcription factor n=1 Tax=Streptomyces sp. NBC_00690 TaxID=2975808 RepID=UPI002E2870B8|nr:winged helix-turn-helix domain-containing protein [Streptomyces sp. NBC_00690]
MLRIHFSAEDLSRIRLAPGPDPAWETLLSLHVLASHDNDIGMLGWRTRMRGSIDPSARPLLRLAPPRGYSPDFLTPAAGTVCAESGIEAILSTPRTQLRTDLATLGREQSLPSWADALARGDAGALRGLGSALRRYQRQALEPYWAQITSAVDAERSSRADAFLSGGTEELLNSLHPAVRWNPPVLEVAYPHRQDLFLQGRGLFLVPSYFCRGTPISLRDGSLTPVLVYPINRDSRALTLHQAAYAPGADTLARLLGRTRAATLLLIADAQDATGGEIARRLDISPASASEHATVLREAGLIRSLRVRNTIRHTLTPLGVELLEGPLPAGSGNGERLDAHC